MGLVFGHPSGLRPLLLTLGVLCLTSTGFAQQDPVPNELNSDVEEPKIHLPEFGQDSPFHSVSQSKIATDDPVVRVAEEAVNATRRRLLSAEQHTPWQIMHGLLALRHSFQIRKDGEIVSGLDWVCSGPTFDNVRWFEKTRHGGRAQPYTRPYAFEGHANQFLAILSMSGLALDHEFQTDQGPITMKDMLRHAQQTLNTKDEITWSLWALSRYLPPDAQWMNERGEPWSIERMVKIQTDAPLKGAPCGGTHGLFALAHARNVYLRHGQPLRGVWLEAEYKIRTYINTARMQQNSDGSLSSNYFRGREYDQDFNERMASAGHVLEFLMIAMPQEELQEPWIRRAVQATATDLLNNRAAYVKCSPLYHAVNGLSIYLDRMKVKQTPAQVAEQEDGKRTAATDPARMTDGKTAPGKGVPVSTTSRQRTLEDKPETPEPTKADSDTKSDPEKPVAEELVPPAESDVPQASPEPSGDTESPEASEATPDQLQTESEATDASAGVTDEAPGWRSTLDDRRSPIALPQDAEPGSLRPVPETVEL